MVEEADVVEGCRAVGFTLGMPAVGMLGVVDDLLVDRAFIAERQTRAAELATIDDLAPARPRHIVANALAAAALARAYGVAAGGRPRRLRASSTGRHRIETVARRRRRPVVDDSKATNPHAAAASLPAFEPVVWIAGGLAKGVDYDDLVRPRRSRLKAVVLIGADSAICRPRWSDTRRMSR